MKKLRFSNVNDNYLNNLEILIKEKSSQWDYYKMFESVDVRNIF